MKKEVVLVRNQIGLHARPAILFVDISRKFSSAIWIERDERRVNAKSSLGVLSLGIIGGTQIAIIAEGFDEDEAVKTLKTLLELIGGNDDKKLEDFLENNQHINW